MSKGIQTCDCAGHAIREIRAVRFYPDGSCDNEITWVCLSCLDNGDIRPGYFVEVSDED